MTTVHRTAIPKVWELDSFDLTVSSKITYSQRPNGNNTARAVGPEPARSIEESGLLPATVYNPLRHQPPSGGEIRIRACSTIVLPESAEVLDAIRRHSRLKGYLEAEAPEGYLLIKPKSNPNNFVRRCRELGFKITLLHSGCCVRKIGLLMRSEPIFCSAGL